MAFSNGGYLAFASSSTGQNFGTYLTTGINIGSDNTPAAADVNGTYWAAYIVGGNLYTASWYGSIQTGGPYYIPLGYTPTGTPALLSSGGNLILAFRSGSNIVLASGNGSSFTTQYVSSAYPATSSPALSTFAGGTALVWFTGTGSGVVAKFPAGNLSSPTSVASAGGMLGGDPAAAEYNGGLFIFARSYYSANNLWATGTTDGINFQPWHMYGQTLTDSPGVAVSGTILSQVGRSNSGSNIWSCVATY